MSCIYYRHPASIARIAADVDRLSNGRLVLGLGIGDAAPESAALGLPFPPARERQQALEEAIEIIAGLWSGQPFTYHGKHFHVNDATVRPGPVQQPYVPLLIAGGGERVTLRQVARYADISNFAPHEWAGSAFTVDDVRRKLDVLRHHCEAQGRPYASILHSYSNFPVIVAETHEAVQAKWNALGWGEFYRSSALVGTPREVIAYYQLLVNAGIQYFTAYIGGNDSETVRLLAEQVLPALVPTQMGVQHEPA